MEKALILIIDDDPGLRKTLSDILRAKGYETLQAGNGTEAIALLEQNQVNLALLDLGLPDIPGIKILRRIKSNCPSTEAIILTGNATLESAVEATNQGAFSYLTKPYDIEQLILQIRRAVEKQLAEKKIVKHILELQKVNSELKTLYEISQATSRTLDLDELVSEVLQTLLRTGIFPFEMHGAIYLVEEDGINLISFDTPVYTVVKPCVQIRPGECLCGLAVETGEVVYSRNTVEEGRHALCHPDTVPHGRIVIPLKAVNRIIGILTLYTRAGTEVENSHIKLFSALGSQIGIALNNARLYEEVKDSSLRDHLTGLLNRRFLQIQLEKSVEAAKRYAEELSVIMLDIDHFKAYNDKWGHVDGDRLLTEIARILTREMRSSDYVFRYGGEEFLALLPRTGIATAYDAAERMRKSIESETGVTISLGVAMYREGMPDGETLIGCADSALYRAKQEGRNRVVVDERATTHQPPPYQGGGAS